MKIVVTQENLARALSTVGRVAGNKTSLPILNNILVRTENNRLLLAATNLEIAVTEYIGAKIQSEGSITLPARLLTEYISNLPKSNISLSLDGSKLHISTDNYKSVINGINADEFPALPEIGSPLEIRLPSSLVKKAITQTILTASHDDTRPILTGIYLHQTDGKLYMAATDGYRLSEKYLQDTTDEINAIIPAQALQDVVRVMPDDCDEVVVLIDAQQVRFRLNDIEITSRLIDGKFPDYTQLIPKNTEVSFVGVKDELNRITKVASLFARESGGSITIKTDSVEKTVSIHSLASQLGENESKVNVEPTGDGQVTLNSRYLIEALGVIDSPQISFGFSGKLSPCVLKPVATDDYVHIIMPLKS